jgi:hypothetical protein
MIEFIISDVDANLGVAFGTCWSADDSQLLGLSTEAKQVLASAACMIDITEVEDPKAFTGSSYSTFIAPIKAIRAINEVKNGMNKVVPHLHLDGTKIREVPSVVANASS